MTGFRVSVPEAGFLLPAVNAMKRAGDGFTVQIDPGPSVVRMKTQDAANNTFGEVTINIGSHVNDVDGDYNPGSGQFYLDGGEFDAAVRTANKTDPFTMEVVFPTFQQIADATTIRSSEISALEDSRFDSTQDLFNASDSQLGSIDGIETDRVDFIQGLLRPYLRVVTDGEETVPEGDYTDAPRLQPERNISDEPEQEYVYEWEANAAKLSRIIRAGKAIVSSASGAQAGVGPRNGQLRIGVIADTSEMLGEPEADIVSSPRAPEDFQNAYRLDRLRDFTLAIDKKKSTTVRIGQPGEDNLLRWDYTLGDSEQASVRLVLAPRIGGGPFIPETGSALRILEDTAFRATTDGTSAKRMFQAQSSLADEYKIYARPEGLVTRVVDNANVLMADVQIDPQGFDSYTAESSFPTRPIGVIADWFNDALSLFRQQDTFTLGFDVDNRRYAINHDIFTISYGSIDPDSMRQEPDLPELDVSGTADVTFDSFRRGVNNVLAEADGAVYGQDGASAAIVAPGSSDASVTELDAQNVNGRALGVYSGEYLEDIIDGVPAPGSDRVNISTGVEFPLVFELEPSNVPGLSITYLLAPRVISDDSDGDDKAAARAFNDAGLDFAWFLQGERPDKNITPLSDRELNSPEDRIREDRLSTFPVTAEVSLSSYTGEVNIEDLDDIGAGEPTKEEAKEAFEEEFDFDLYDGGEDLGTVTFTSETSFETDFADPPIDIPYRISGFSRLGDEPNSISFTAIETEVPTRGNVGVHLFREDDDDPYNVYVRLRREAKPMEELPGEVVAGPFDTLREAWPAFRDYLETTSLEEMVEDLGVPVDITLKDLRDELKQITQQYASFRLESEPQDILSGSDFIYSMMGTYSPNSAVRVRVQLNGRAYDDDKGGYAGFGTVTALVRQPNDSSEQIPIHEVDGGIAPNREDIPDQVQALIDAVREFEPRYIPEKGSDEVFGNPVSGRELSDKVDQFFPFGTGGIRDTAADRGIPVDFTDVTGVGPSRAETLEEVGVEDMVDLTAALIIPNTFDLEGALRDLPNDPAQRLRETAQELWDEVAWPQYRGEMQGGSVTPITGFDTSVRRDEIDLGFGDSVEEDLDEPDGRFSDRDTGRANVAVVRSGSSDFGEYWDYVPIQSGEPEPTEELLEAARDDDFRELEWYHYEEGDVVAFQRWDKEVRRGFRKIFEDVEPGLDVLRERYLVNGDEVPTTETDEWRAVTARGISTIPEGAFLGASFGGRVVDQRNDGTVVGFPAGGYYFYQKAGPNDQSFIFKYDPEDDEIIESTVSDDRWVSTTYSTDYYLPDNPDDALGYIPQTDSGPWGSDIFTKDMIPPGYEIDPFVRSGDEAEDLIGRTVYYRKGSGDVYESEVRRSSSQGATVNVEFQMDLVDQWAIPASSKSENNQGDIIAIPTDAEAASRDDTSVAEDEDDQDPEEQESDSTGGTLRDSDGSFKFEDVENATYWAAQALGRIRNGPYSGLSGDFYIDIAAGEPIVVLGPKFDKSAAEALKDDFRDAGFPQPIRIRELDDEIRVFIAGDTGERSVGDYYDGDWREFEAQSDFSDTARDTPEDAAGEDAPTPMDFRGVDSDDVDPVPDDPADSTVPVSMELADDIKDADPVRASELGRRVQPGDVVGYKLARGALAWAVVFPEEVPSPQTFSGEAFADATYYIAENILLGGPEDDSDYIANQDTDEEGWVSVAGIIEADTAVPDDPAAHRFVIPQLDQPPEEIPEPETMAASTAPDEPEVGTPVLFEELFGIDYQEALEAVDLSDKPLDLDMVRGIGDSREDTLREAGIRNTMDATMVIQDPSPQLEQEQAIQEMPPGVINRLENLAEEIDFEVLNELKETPAESDADDDFDPDGLPDDAIEVVSPNRPFPRAALDNLRDLGLFGTESPGEPGRQEVAYVEEEPTDRLIAEYELSVTVPPIEVWESDDGSRAEIFPDLVTFDGETQPSDPEDTAQLLRERNEWSPVRVPDDSPFGGTGATDDAPAVSATFYTDVETLLDSEYDEDPDPADDPPIRYLHPGAEYETPSGQTLIIEAWAKNADPPKGVVRFRDPDGGRVVDESDSDIGGVSQSVLDPFTTDDPDTGVWSGEGVLAGVRDLKLLKQDSSAYADVYFNRRDAGGDVGGSGGGEETRRVTVETRRMTRGFSEGAMGFSFSPALEDADDIARTIRGALRDLFTEEDLEAISNTPSEIVAFAEVRGGTLSEEPITPSSSFEVETLTDPDELVDLQVVDSAFRAVGLDPDANQVDLDAESDVGEASEDTGTMSTSEPDFPIRATVRYREDAQGGVTDPDGIEPGAVVLEGVPEGAVSEDASSEVLNTVALVQDFRQLSDGETVAEVTFTARDDFSFEEVETGSEPLDESEFELMSDFGSPSVPSLEPLLVARNADGTEVEVYEDRVFAYPADDLNGGSARAPQDAVRLQQPPEQATEIIESNDNWTIIQDNRTPEPESQGSTSSPSTDDTSADPVVAGLTESELEDAIEAATPGIAVTVNASDASLRIIGRPDDPTPVRLSTTPGPAVGNRDDAESLVRSFIEDYNIAVDTDSITPTRIAESRLDTPLPDELVPDVEESKEAQQERTDAREEAAQEASSDDAQTGDSGGPAVPSSEFARRLIEGELDPDAATEEQLRRAFTGIIEADGDLSRVAADVREFAMGLAADNILQDQLPELFDEAGVSLNFGMGGDVDTVVLSGSVKPDAEDRIAGASIFTAPASGRPDPVLLKVDGPPAKGDKIIDDLRFLFEYMDKQNQENADFHRKLDELARASVASISQATVSLPDLFIPAPMLRPPLTRGAGPTLKKDINDYLETMDSALLAAQRVYELQTGASVREQIEREIGAFPADDSVGGLLQSALQELDAGEFDPVDFLRRYFLAFKRDVPADIFDQEGVQAARSIDGDTSQPDTQTQPPEPEPDTQPATADPEPSPEPEPEPGGEMSETEQRAVDLFDRGRDVLSAVDDALADVDLDSLSPDVDPTRVGAVVDAVESNVDLLRNNDSAAFTPDGLDTIAETVDTLEGLLPQIREAAAEPEPEPAVVPEPTPEPTPTTTPTPTRTPEPEPEPEPEPDDAEPSPQDRFADASLEEILAEEGPLQVEVFVFARGFGNVFAIRLPSFPDKILREGQGVGDDVALRFQEELDPDSFREGEVVGTAVVDDQQVFSISINDRLGDIDQLGGDDSDAPPVETEPAPDPDPPGTQETIGGEDLGDVDARDINIEGLTIEDLDIGSFGIENVNVTDPDGSTVQSIRDDIENDIDG